MAFSFTGVDTAQNSPIPSLSTLRSDGTSDNQFFLSSTAKENGLLVPVAAIQTGLDTNTFSIGDAKPLEPKTIIIPNTNVSVGWGRWSAQYVVARNDTIQPHLGQLHYIVASNTTSLAQLGGLGGTLSYTTIGGTRATDFNGKIAADFANVTMGVDFTSNIINSFDVITNVGGSTYDGSAFVVPISSANIGITLSGGSNCSSCTGNANVSFFGPNAEGAGATYAIQEPISGNTVNGAAILISQ